MKRHAIVKHEWIFLALMSFNVGCLPISRPTTDVEPKKPADANRIEITNSFYGGESRTAKWVLEKSGPCRGTITSGSNADGRQNRTTEYELPAETFEECRALLESTKFFSLKVPRFPFPFEASGWRISATFNGRSNSVDDYTQTPPERFARVRDFLDGLPKRGKVISSSPDQSR